MKVALSFLGCRVNQAEISDLERDLISRGHTIVELSEEPDMCIVNTCTVTSKSDYQSRQLIRHAAKTGARVLATGCYAQMNPEEILKIDGVESVIPNQEKPYIINQFIDISSKITLTTSQNLKKKSKFFLKVQDGCDNSCTYCRVWLARGPSRSIAQDQIISSAREAEAAGYNEIVLTGVHLGMYGRDIGMTSCGVANLLEQILANTEQARIRLSSMEVTEIDDHLLDLMTDARVCRHLHIPIQSGDDGVLDRMGRGYSRKDVIDKISDVTRALGDIGMGSDIIAGFPTEDEPAFGQTIDLVENLPLTYLHVFPYSPRAGTVAADIKEDISADEKKSRAALLREIGQRKSLEYINNQVGKCLTVLLETHKPDGSWVGTSGNFLKVRVAHSAGCDKSHKQLIKGHIVNAEIKSVEGAILYGEAGI